MAAQTDASAETAMRRAEKHFKTRAAPHPNPRFRKRVPARPSLVALPACCLPVLDLSGPSRRPTPSSPRRDGGGVDASMDGGGGLGREGEEEEVDEVEAAGWWEPGEGGVVLVSQLGKRSTYRPEDEAMPVVVLKDGRHGFVVAHGCVLVPRYLPPAAQLALLRTSLADYTRAPSNLDTHYDVPPSPSLFALALDAPHTPVRPRHADLGPAELARLRAGERSGQKGRRTIDVDPDSVGRPVAERTEAEGASTQPATAPAPSTRVGEKRADDLLRELRWTNLGLFYNWTHKAYDLSLPTPPFPPELAILCKEAVRAVPWEQVLSDSTGAQWVDDYEPETGIVNFYQLGDTLMAHVDRSELDPSRPLVSISLGHAAILLLGTSSRADPPRPLVLRSGDVLIMSGPGRTAYHGVPRILEGTLPAHFAPDDADDKAMRGAKSFIASARININARQVFPPGHARAA
ncbi:hypothetical protein Q5752_000470 [Cryptotrichosporon argae]